MRHRREAKSFARKRVGDSEILKYDRMVHMAYTNLVCWHCYEAKKCVFVYFFKSVLRFSSPLKRQSNETSTSSVFVNRIIRQLTNRMHQDDLKEKD